MPGYSRVRTSVLLATLLVLAAATPAFADLSNNCIVTPMAACAGCNSITYSMDAVMAVTPVCVQVPYGHKDRASAGAGTVVGPVTPLTSKTTNNPPAPGNSPSGGGAGGN